MKLQSTYFKNIFSGFINDDATIKTRENLIKSTPEKNTKRGYFNIFLMKKTGFISWYNNVYIKHT